MSPSENSCVTGLTVLLTSLLLVLSPHGNVPSVLAQSRLRLVVTRTVQSLQLGSPTRKMCLHLQVMVSQQPSNVMREWMDGIFPEELEREETRENREYVTKNGGRTRSLCSLNRKARQEILILDPLDTEVLENKKDLLLKSVKHQLENLVEFYIRECAYTPILYIFLLTFLSNYLSGVLCLAVSLVLCVIVLLVHYLYVTLSPVEEDEDA